MTETQYEMHLKQLASRGILCNSIAVEMPEGALMLPCSMSGAPVYVPTQTNTAGNSFPELVAQEIANTGCTKLDAVRILVNRNRKEYLEWLKAGGGKL